MSKSARRPINELDWQREDVLMLEHALAEAGVTCVCPCWLIDLAAVMTPCACLHASQALHLPVARRLNDAASRAAGRIAQQQADTARVTLQHDIRLLEQSITWESTQLHTIGDAISQLALDNGTRATARQHIAQLLDDSSSTAAVGSTPLLVQAARCVHACACLHSNRVRDICYE